jgi:drug/metabolite transporter (DMT)-like permease
LLTVLLTLLALGSFAANSLLTRLALGGHAIDATSFTAIRLVAGAVTLAALVRARDGSFAALASSSARRGHSLVGPAALFGYALPFSLAYLRIGAAVGALVAFGTVQTTMIGYGLVRGERPSAIAWIGIAIAASGLVVLMLPSVSRPDPVGVVLMMAAGVAWAVYTIAGRASQEPVAENARSFVWSSIAALVTVVARPAALTATPSGVALALVSGAVTSGLGYAIWYRALPRLSVTQAAVAQVSVPLIASAGAVALLGETLSPRLAICGAAILAGVALVLRPSASTTS